MAVKQKNLIAAFPKAVAPTHPLQEMQLLLKAILPVSIFNPNDSNANDNAAEPDASKTHYLPCHSRNFIIPVHVSS